MYEEQTFTNIMNRMLDRVSDEFDKREGSVIYDALAPAAMELSEAYIELDNVLSNTFAATCSRDFLVAYAEERGIEPKPATAAVIKLLTMPTYVEVPIGSVFTIGLYNYTITEQINPGEYAAICNTPGVDGGSVTSEMDIIPVVEVNDLESVTFDSVIKEGVNEEDTESLRKRYINSLKPYSFGGNVADYTAKTLSVDGVGACRGFRAGTSDGEIIPGGNVSICILNSAFAPASATLIAAVQEVLDPNPGMGEGLAPIGHAVTVRTVANADISISLAVKTTDGQISADIQTVIEATINQYFIALRKTWADGKSGIVVRRAQIEEEVYNLNTVEDCQVTALNIYGESDTSHNLTLSLTEIPALHDITITPLT